MKKQDESVQKIWSDFLESIEEDVETTDKVYSSWHFENNEKDANELAELVLAGKKRGTASSLWVYEFDNEPIPEQGEFSIITDWNGHAKCIIETTRINIVPYKDVDEAFVIMEGEGDCTLEYWRKGHERFFIAECRRIGKVFNEDMPVICEEFVVVYSE